MFLWGLFFSFFVLVKGGNVTFGGRDMIVSRRLLNEDSFFAAMSIRNFVQSHSLDMGIRSHNGPSDTIVNFKASNVCFEIHKHQFGVVSYKLCLDEFYTAFLDLVDTVQQLKNNNKQKRC